MSLFSRKAALWVVRAGPKLTFQASRPRAVSSSSSAAFKRITSYRQRHRSFCTRTTARGFAERAQSVVMKHSNAIGLAGFCLLTVQWCMEDVLLLRCIGCTVSTCMIVFNYFRTPPIMTAVRFNALFVVINGYFITKLLLERRDLELDKLEQLLWDSAFCEHLSKVQLRALLAVGNSRTVSAGELFREAGKSKTDKMVVIVSGKAEVRTPDGDVVAVLAPGEFVGEFGFIQQDSEVAQTTVEFRGDTQVIEWTASRMKTHLAEHAAVRHSLEALWMRTLKGKLARMNENETHRSYVNVLRGVTADGVVGPEERQFVEHFCASRGISRVQQECALHEIGYSLSGFEKLFVKEKKIVASKYELGEMAI